MFGLGHMELILILIIGVLFFGAKKLPEIGKALGRVKGEYASGRKSVQSGEGAETSDQEAGSGEPDLVHDLEDELKSRLVSHLPGVGQINKIKRTVDTVSKVTGMIDKEKKG